MGSAARKLRVWRMTPIWLAHLDDRHPVLVHVEIGTGVLSEGQIRDRMNSLHWSRSMSNFWWELTELPPISDSLS